MAGGLSQRRLCRLMVDRLVHNAEVIAIEGESSRLKEAQERADQRAHQRRQRRGAKP